jgi:hypothetical protein
MAGTNQGELRKTDADILKRNEPPVDMFMGVGADPQGAVKRRMEGRDERRSQLRGIFKRPPRCER